MAIAATMQWDVRTTGSDSNGGGFDSVSGVPGTDYSQQNSPQVAFTDLVIGATNTQLTSALNPFTAAHVGNVINITSGTGFTTGRYQVMSVSGSTATMDRAVGTASSTGGNGNLGGSLLTIQTGVTIACTYVAGNIVHVKAGTYTITSNILFSNSLTGMVFMVGYQTTHFDMGTPPLITCATNSVNLISDQTTALLMLANLSFSHTATTRGNGVSADSGNRNLFCFKCTFDGCHRAINGDWTQVFIFTSVYCVQVEIKNCTEDGIVNNNGGSTYFYDCNIHNNAGNGMSDKNFNTSVTIIAENSLFTSNGAAGLSLAAPSTCRIRSCTFASNTTAGFLSGGGGIGSAGNCGFQDSIFYGNGTYGVSFTSALTYATAWKLLSFNNAYGANTTAPTNGFTDNSPVTLTANPFVSSGTGNYALNSTSGGGAACKGAGYPGAFPGGTSTGSLDIGAVQSAAGGGGGSTGGSWAFVTA